MCSFIRVLSVICSVLYSSIYVAAQSASPAPGLIIGRVTTDGKASSGIEVVLLPDEGDKRTAIAKAATDADGRFRLTVEYAGRYRVVPVAPAFIAPTSDSELQGKSITIAAGEEVNGVELSLTRGGVITGQVKTPAGQPAIAEHVTVTPLSKSEQDRVQLPRSPATSETDDRGVYRVFGLAPGRYIVSAGSSNEVTPVALHGRRASYARTYHPDATDESRATVIEVSAGAEASKVDINLSRRTRSVTATGRVVDAKRNEPLANIPLGYAALSNNGKVGRMAAHGFRSDSKGEFKIEGLLPGRYIVFVTSEIESNSFSADLAFDVPTDDNVSGLEVRVHQGSSVSGVVVVENARDPNIIGRLSGLPVVNFLYQMEMMWTEPKLSRINADATFRLGGLRPGKLKINTNRQSLPRGFSIVRLERDGVALGDGMDIQPETNIAGVRVILSYGTGVVRGQVKIRGGELSPETRLLVFARKLGTDAPLRPAATVDARGRFVIEWLAAGDYELALSPKLPAGAGGEPPSSRGVTSNQFVRVTDNGELEVTLSYDVGATGGQGGQ